MSSEQERSPEYDAAAAIQRRIDLIRAESPDVVPGVYQQGYADGLESALAEIRFAETTRRAAVTHVAALNIGTSRVVCTCGAGFREHAYDGDAVAQFARHIRDTRVTPSGNGDTP